MNEENNQLKKTKNGQIIELIEGYYKSIKIKNEEIESLGE